MTPEALSVFSDFARWHVTSDVFNHRFGGCPCSSGACECCGKEHLKHHFKIQLKGDTSVARYVGSSCILKYGIRIDGLMPCAPQHERSRALRVFKKLSDAQLRAHVARKLLETLRALDNRPAHYDDYLERKAYSPNQLAHIAWRLKVHQIPFDVTVFNLDTSRRSSIRRLNELLPYQLKLIQPALSKPVLKRMEKLKAADEQTTALRARIDALSLSLLPWANR